MWTKPGARPLRFEAVEDLSVAKVEFSWTARFPVAFVLSLTVVDRYVDGEGLLEGRLFGLPVMRRRGPELTTGEATRYLAELPWVPHAVEHNHELAWSEVDVRTLEVSTQAGSSRVSVRLEVDDGGDVVRARADARPRIEGKAVVTRPWSGVFSDHGTLGGVRVPRRAEVSWELPDGPFTYWRGELTALETVAP